MGAAVAERGMSQVVGEEGGGSACRVGVDCAVGWVWPWCWSAVSCSPNTASWGRCSM